MRRKRHWRPADDLRAVFVARLVGATGSVGVYLWLREFVSFKGMYRSYDVLTVAVVGSLIGASMATAGLPHASRVGRRWATYASFLALIAAIVYLADRRLDLGLSVRLAVISLVAVYEMCAPGIRFRQRAFFGLLPIVGAAVHAHLFMANTVTPATIASIGAGAAGALFVLGAVYSTGVATALM